ncbi:DUF2972 domain-containing protein, partial [Campylobacter upsaliensis]|nr:DUF2972 domain-containing protein [Campylobacter upsaliensis]
LKLRKIQKMHKAHQKFYKKTTVVFPQLHYPALENCEDYKESLKCKFHLSYLLGEVFIKALKKWYKGGLLKLNKDFKKAYENFKFCQNFFYQNPNVDLLTLEFCASHKDLFFKYYPDLQNLMQYHKDYLALKETLMINISFVLKHFKRVEEWLNSEEFKEKYKSINHSYPPLLNPDILNELLAIKCDGKDDKQNLKDHLQQQALKLNLSKEVLAYINAGFDYRLISAELAWELNLPLPRRYEFVLVAAHGTGSKALGIFFKLCQTIWIECTENGKESFIYFFNCLILYSGYKFLAFQCLPTEYKKLLALMTRNVDYLFLVRDPFEIWTSYSNHRIKNDSFNKTININDNLYEALNVFLYLSSWANKPLMPDEKNEDTWARLDERNMKCRSCAFEGSIIKYAKNCKNIYYIQTKDLHKDKAFETMKYLGKTFSFDVPNSPKLFEEQRIGDLNIFFPRTILFDNKFNLTIEIQTIYMNYDENIFTDIKTLIYPKDGAFFNEIVLLYEKKKMEFLTKFQIKQLVEYFKKFSMTIKERLEIESKNRIKPEDHLKVFQKSSKTRTKLKEIYDREFQFIKANRPDIVNSWKYYKEFEKICEDFKE